MRGITAGERIKNKEPQERNRRSQEFRTGLSSLPVLHPVSRITLLVDLKLHFFETLFLNALSNLGRVSHGLIQSLSH